MMARILLAEDDLSMCAFIAKALANAGHDVTVTHDGLAAMKKLEAGEKFDLLLSDIVMPGMDGIELSKKASRMHPDLKIMFITGFSAVAANLDNDRSAPKPARVFSKPFHLNDLVAQINAALAD